jgi:hypothetical protein
MLDTMSFSRELLNERSRQPPKESLDIMNKMNEETRPRGKDPSPNAFNSVEFGTFLSKELPKSFGSVNPFLSKENSLPNFDSSLFKSKEAFSKLFASPGWEMKFPAEDLKTSVQEEEPPIPKSMSTTVPVERKEALKEALSSTDWMSLNTLGSHMDVSYTLDMFSGSDSEAPANESELTAELPPARTDWDNMFFSQLQLFPPPVTSLDETEDTAAIPLDDTEDTVAIPQEQASSDGILATATEEPVLPEVFPAVSQQVQVATPEPVDTVVQGQSSKKKRKRKPRKKAVPEVKEYVEHTDSDVLLGRGGRSNHHPGNKRYREEVTNLQSWYLGIEGKDEKTDLSQCLVDYVHSYEGRFLENDKAGWYVVPNIVARRKASQALREDNDPEKRAAKRTRFLKKKAEMEKKQKQRER